MRRERDIDAGELPQSMRRGWAGEMARRLREMERNGFFRDGKQSDFQPGQRAQRRDHRGRTKRGT